MEKKARLKDVRESVLLALVSLLPPPPSNSYICHAQNRVVHRMLVVGNENVVVVVVVAEWLSGVCLCAEVEYVQYLLYQADLQSQIIPPGRQHRTSVKDQV